MSTHSNLDSFYNFFKHNGSERFRGLDESHFIGLSKNEKEIAWKFLEEKFESSVERIRGLYILDRPRAIELFKRALSMPMENAEFAADRLEVESARLLMLKCVNNIEPDERYLIELLEFATSEFEEVRAEFASSVPAKKIIPEAIDALKCMIFTEVERVPLASAVGKLMAIYGLDFDLNDSFYKSIYRSLRLGNIEEKKSAVSRLEKCQNPDYI